MIPDYLALGGTEIANSARLAAYLETVGSALHGAGSCGCETFTAAALGDSEYTVPEDEASPAPWYDPDVPESMDFAGFLVLSAEGLDDHPVARTVTGAVTGGGVNGAGRTQARTITVTGLLLGATCCAVDYGRHWLAQALEGCTGTGCGGDCLTLYNCCPSELPDDVAEFRERHRRTMRRVALVEGPRVVAQTGDSCSGRGGCSTGADILTVEFVLSAATPWAWTDPVTVLDREPLPRDDSEECIDWCVHGGSGPEPDPPLCFELADTPDDCPGDVTVEFDDECPDGWVSWEEPPIDPCEAACRLVECPDERDGCADPSCAPARPPMPAAPDTCHCLALAADSEVYDLDLSGRSGWSADAPIITLEAGSEDLRRVTLSIFERRAEYEDLTCEEVVEEERCSPHSVYQIGYVPAGGTLTLDGQIGRALVECGGECETARDVWGRDGGPPSWRLLDCDRYCLLVEADAIVPPADDATLTIELSGRGY